jgi:hypothetical protein
MQLSFLLRSFMARQKKPAARGRPFKKVFINVSVLDKTRIALNELKKVTGLSTQGELIDAMVADVMSRKPKDF